MSSILKAAKGRLKEDEARKYFQQLINAVDYCHSRGVFHRDLKVKAVILTLVVCCKNIAYIVISNTLLFIQNGYKIVFRVNQTKLARFDTC